MAVLALAGFGAAQLLYRPLARLMAAPASLADPAGLPVLAVIAALWIALSGVAVAGLIRTINVRADAEALDASREPDGLASSLIADWNGQCISPSRFEEAVLYTHSPLAQRLRQAMAWKAAHSSNVSAAPRSN